MEKTHRRKIALVNQRYGLEVNGGSEYYTRELAEHLKDIYDVEIITTKALNYDTWENYYKDDIEVINGVTVRRFDVDKKRSINGMRIFSRLRKYFSVIRRYAEKKWIEAQGPVCTRAIEYIENHVDEYDAIIYVTYLYYLTAMSLIEDKDTDIREKLLKKAILLPTAHDEPYIYYSIYKEVFENPSALIYLTPEEKEFVEKHFHVSEKPSVVAGAGVELPDNIDNEAYRRKYKLVGDYIIYVGRIDKEKGCPEMFDAFLRYKEEHPEDKTKLVLMGKAMVDIPKSSYIIYQGFVPEEDKFSGIRGAKALWLPSQFESLSIAVLESMALGVPVIVNGQCEVLKGHCIRSGAGLYYCNNKQAVSELEKILYPKNNELLSSNTMSYVDENYRWDDIIDKICSVIEAIY